MIEKTKVGACPSLKLEKFSLGTDQLVIISHQNGANYNKNQRDNMTSKSQARRNKRHADATEASNKPADSHVTQKPVQPTAKPTKERLARGNWTSPDNKGGGAYVDLACDMIGRLLVSKQITGQQAQTARAFSEVYGAYLEEIGISESKSCLAVSSGGFDPSDGDEAVFKRYYAIRDKIGRVRTSMLQTECAKMADETPHSILALRESLDALDK
jgi:hypothetical protein